jgi:hypothetical protein
MSKPVDELTLLDIKAFLAGDEFMIDRYRQIQGINAELSGVIEGITAPTFSAPKHQQYFDTVTSKYYRNTNGGTTWVALN